MICSFQLMSRRTCLMIVWGLFAVTLWLGPARAADIEAAREQFKTGQYEECLKTAEKAIDEGAYQTEWPLLAVESTMALGRYDEAAGRIDTLLRQMHPSIRLLKLAHTAYQRNGQDDQAAGMLAIVYRIARTRRAEYMSNDDVVALGESLLLLGAEPRMVLDDFYNQAIGNDPNCRNAYLAAGALALAKQDYELAADHFRQALARFGDDPDVHCGLAEAFYHSDRGIMVQSLDAALQVNPSHAPALILRAEHLIDCESYEAAAESLHRVHAVNPWQPQAWAYRAVLAHVAADSNAVNRYRNNALKFWPANPEIDHLIGRKLSMKYRFAEGATYQRQALKFDPDYLPAKIQLARDLLRLGNEEQGWALADEVNTKDPYNVEAYNLVNLHDKFRELRTLTRDGFIIRMNEREADVYGDQVADLLKEAKAKLCPKYGLELKNPVTVELFDNQQDFAVRTFGMPGGDGFLGVCFGNVITTNSPRIERRANWKATLWHEFCHVVTLNLTQNKMPRWLSEGISVYEELQRNPAWGQKMIPRYREMILGGELTPVGELSSAFMNPPSPLHLQFAYYQSALVVEFLVERFGFATLRRILADLAQGMEINSAIAAHAGPIDKIEGQFEAFARERAEDLAPQVHWEQPERETVNPSDEEALTQWLTHHPNSFWALQQRARRLLANEQWEQAKGPLGKLISLYPEHVAEGNAYELLAQVHRQLGETEQEVEVLAQLARRSADAREAYERLTEIGIETENWCQVVENGEKYLAVYPMLGTVHWRLGQAYEALGQTKQAIVSYERLLRLEPSDPVEIHYRLAHLLRPRDARAAKRHVLEALADAPRFRQGHRLLLSILADTSVSPTEMPPEDVEPSPAQEDTE
ncbi:MAG: tetratricopeptide repeat protein [Sedimentisphaerales bacterium]|nr:tetratricopeptide repeat protein [Sedimentisphaerales bacterium]